MYIHVYVFNASDICSRITVGKYICKIFSVVFCAELLDCTVFLLFELALKMEFLETYFNQKD